MAARRRGRWRRARSRAGGCGASAWPLHKPSRFSDWDRLVRGALLWLGETDPIWTQESVAAADSVRGDLGAVIEAIRKHPQLGDDEPFSAKQAASCAIAPGDLQTALTAALPNGKVTTKAVSSSLNRKRTDYRGLVHRSVHRLDGGSAAFPGAESAQCRRGWLRASADAVLVRRTVFQRKNHFLQKY